MSEIRAVVLAFCERCGREFYTATSARKFCDVPTCQGYLRHIDRSRHRGLSGTPSEDTE